MAEVAGERGWHDAPWPLIVVAAVRAGVVVRISSADQPPMPLPWAGRGRPTGSGALTPEDERRLRVAAASGAVQGVVDRLVGGALARALTRRMWGVSADAVTAISVASALFAGLLVASGTRGGAVLAAAFLALSVLLDRVDGMVARATRSATGFGAWLDATGDRLREAALVIGLAVGAAQRDDPRWGLAAAVLALLALAQLSAAASLAARGWGGAPSPVRIPLDRLDEPSLPAIPPPPGRALPGWLPFSVSRGDGSVLVVVGLALLSPDALLVALAVAAAVSAVVCILLVGSPRPLPAAQRQLWELVDPGPLARVVARQDPQLSLWRRVLATPAAAWAPPVTWLLEAGGVLAVVVFADPEALPITLAWIGVLAFHRLDLATRLQVLQLGVPSWLGVVGLGALGRLLLVIVLAGAGLLTYGLAAGAVALGVVYAAESAGRFADRR
jgi:phosphatidylglycerophosphate synthase